MFEIKAKLSFWRVWKLMLYKCTLWTCLVIHDYYYQCSNFISSVDYHKFRHISSLNGPISIPFNEWLPYTSVVYKLLLQRRGNTNRRGFF